MARSNLPIPKDPDQCPPWLYEYLKRLNQTANKTAVGIAQVARGEVPDGSGQPLPGADTSGFFLLAGRGGGQIGRGGRTAGENLTLSSTDSASKGKIFFGLTGQTYRSALDETQGFLGINLIAPAATLHIVGSLAGSSGAFTPNSDIANNWGGPRSGAGGGGIGGTDFAALASNDGITSYVAVLPTIDGNNPQKNGLSGTIMPGASYTVTVMLACFSSTIDVTRSAWRVSLIDSAGNQWASAATFSILISPFTVAEVAGMTPAQTFFAVTRTVTCSGTPISTGNTANAVWMEASMLNAAGTQIYTLASYITVSTAGAPILRWDFPSGTQSGGIDLFGHMGIGTGTSSPGAVLDVIPDLATAIGIRSKAVASQTADLLQIANSSGVALSGFNGSGNPYLVANAALDAVLASDASGVGGWQSLVAWEDEIVFWEDSPVYI